MSETPSSTSPPVIEEAFARYVMARDLVANCDRSPGPRMWASSSSSDRTEGGHERADMSTTRTTRLRVVAGAAKTRCGLVSANAALILQDVRMPWNVHQVTALPPRVEEAHDVIKTPLRLQIAHFLADHPNSRIGAIMEAVGSERATVRSNLATLEGLGVISASLPAGERESLPVLYSLNRTRWTEMIIRLITYLPAAPDDVKVRD